MRGTGRRVGETVAYLGIDLGGTYARAAVVDAKGRILSSSKTALIDRTPVGVVEAIGLAAEEALAGVPGPIQGCGVGVAGMLEGDSGVVAVAPNLHWRNVPFGAMLAARLLRPVRVVNDLSAAAWGEFHAGAGAGKRDVLVVFVGSGVGSALICNGQLVRGVTGAAGEFGHVKVTVGGRPCGCGQSGCLEAYAGGHNLIAQMREAVTSREHTLLRERAGDDPAKLTPVLLEEAALAGDELAKQIYDRALGFLGIAIANQVTVLNPAALIIGGGVLSRCPNMRREIARAVQQYGAVVARRDVHIVDAALGDDSGIIGAALMADGAR